LKQGMLFEGEHALFDGMACEITIRELLDDGYLAPLTTEPVKTHASTEGVGLRQGEYIASQLADAVDIDRVTRSAVDEITQLGGQRRHWLIFCVSIRHGEHVRDALAGHGIPAALVTGKTSRTE